MRSREPKESGDLRNLGIPRESGDPKNLRGLESGNLEHLEVLGILSISRIPGIWGSREPQESGDLRILKNPTTQTPVFGYFFGPSSLTLKFL